MKKRKRNSLIALAVIATLLTSLIPSSATEAAPKSKMQSYVDDIQPGWNLGNSLDAVGADETAWGNPVITKELIENIAAQGYKSIRIPVTWDAHVGAAPNYTIDPAYMKRVQEVINWALEADLYVMTNVHHDSWLWISKMESKHDEVLARYNAIWTQVADQFKNTSHKLMFESVNEPRFTDGGTYDENKQQAMLDELNDSFFKIVRNSGGLNDTRPLVISTLEATPSKERMDALLKTMTKYNDDNLIATVHYYGFWPFSVNIAGFTKFEGEAVDNVKTTFDEVYNTFSAKGIPVIIGEYGLLGFDKSLNVPEHGEKLKFFEFFADYVKQKGFTTMLWDNGQHFNRHTYTWSDAELFNLIKESWTNRSATGESDLLFFKQGEEVKDTTLKLSLNGTTLSSLSANGAVLEAGKDYEIKDNLLTIKASALSKLLAPGRLGVNSVLVAKFNQGVDWKWNVIVSTTPTLGKEAATTSSFEIPTNFNGDRLATMEAVYETGGNAGPQDWTSYKEFETTFNPDYKSGKIVIKPALFNEMKDGKVQLKFHFWSGEVINYTIEKSGSNIVGAAS